MNAQCRSLVPSIRSADCDAIEPKSQPLELALSGEPSATAMLLPRGLLTQKEAAHFLSISRSTLWRMTKEGIFTLREMRPGMWRYKFSEIEAFINGGRQEPPGLRPTRPQPRKLSV